MDSIVFLTYESKRGVGRRRSPTLAIFRAPCNVRRKGGVDGRKNKRNLGKRAARLAGAAAIAALNFPYFFMHSNARYSSTEFPYTFPQYYNTFRLPILLIRSSLSSTSLFVSTSIYSTTHRIHLSLHVETSAPLHRP